MVNIFSSLQLDIEKVDISLIVQGNYHLRKPSPKSISWETVMDAVNRKGFESVTLWSLFYKLSLKKEIRKLKKKLKRIV